MGHVEFVGLANYQELLSDRVFITKAIPNTLFLTAVVVPAQMALGLALAVIVNQGIRGQTFFRAAFFFPRSPAPRRSSCCSRSSPNRKG